MGHHLSVDGDLEGGESLLTVGLHQVDVDAGHLLRHQRRQLVVVDGERPVRGLHAQPRWLVLGQAILARDVGTVRADVFLEGAHGDDLPGPQRHAGHDRRAPLFAQRLQRQARRHLLQRILQALRRVPQGGPQIGPGRGSPVAAARLAVVAAGDRASTPYCTGVDHSVRYPLACPVAVVVPEVVFVGVGHISEVPVLHARALPAEARRVRRGVAVRVVLRLLRPSLLDDLVRCRRGTLADAMVDVRSEDVLVQLLQSCWVEVPDLFGRRLVSVSLCAGSRGLRLLNRLLTLPLLSVPLLQLQPLLLHLYAQDVESIGDALVGFPRRSLRVAAVLHLRVVDGSVGRSPLHQVELLVEPTLGMHQRFPWRQIFEQVVDLEPAAVWVCPAGRQQLLPQGPAAVLPASSCGVDGRGTRNCGVEQAFLDIQRGAQTALLAVLHQDAGEFLEPRQARHWGAGNRVQHEEAFVPRKQLAGRHLIDLLCLMVLDLHVGSPVLHDAHCAESRVLRPPKACVDPLEVIPTVGRDLGGVPVLSEVQRPPRPTLLVGPPLKP
mmetsp:Transcript_42001/g.105599  ORF Transcript_42001/g.105599 Transcript_42001/m.105599 type:complete len:550 (-) Transcript_42001:38-1687(-)